MGSFTSGAFRGSGGLVGLFMGVSSIGVKFLYAKLFNLVKSMSVVIPPLGLFEIIKEWIEC